MPETSALDARERALLLCGFALEKKAQDLALLEVGPLTTIAEYFIICSGRSDRHVQSIAEGIKEDGRPHGLRPISSEGMERGQWVLMDFSDVLVHVFYEPVRGFYDLDGLWARAATVELPEPYATLVTQFASEGRGAGALDRPAARRGFTLHRKTGSLVRCLTNTVMKMRGHFGRRQGAMTSRGDLRSPQGVHHARKSNAADGQKDPQIRKRICETPH